MLKSATNHKAKRRQLLSLNRPHNTSKRNDSSCHGSTVASSDSIPQPSLHTPLSPSSSSPQSSVNGLELTDSSSSIPSLTDTTTETTTAAAAGTTELLGEYLCPICNKNLSNFRTSFSRQRHIDACLGNSTPTSTSTSDDSDSLEALFLKYCSFCGKDIGHLTGIYKERHFDQCLTTLETEQQAAEQQQRLVTYAGHSIPFLQELDVCPSCHEPFPGGGLRGKVRHIKQCAKQRSLTMEQLLRKIQWMQWGHLPLPNPRPSSPPSTATSDPPLPIRFSVHATNLHSDSNPCDFTVVDTPSSSSTITSGHENDINSIDGDDDCDFSRKVVMYKIASWRQTKIRQPPPTEDEAIAKALSLSLHEEQHPDEHLSKSKRRKRKVDWNVSTVISIEQSRRSARLALERMLEKDETWTMGSLPTSLAPLVTSSIQSRLPSRRSTTSTLSLWSQASCLD